MKIGEFFAVGYKGRGRNQVCVVSPGFTTIEEVDEWLKQNRLRRYVIKQKISEGGGGSDGFEYIESII